MSDDKSGKPCCPNCGNTWLVLIRTHRLKCCLDCHTDIPWPLDKGQKPVSYEIEIEETI